jgi:GrpB-like predicted nucleotidyltransferase (UPF0157 family)
LVKSLKQRIAEAVREKIEIVPYHPSWPAQFRAEAARLNSLFPPPLINRIEHFGSTAVPGLAAKPVIDMMVEVSSLAQTKRRIVPILKGKGYEYFWRPEFDKPPMYAWFIKRNGKGERTHHLHMVEADSKLWDRIYFRNYLRRFPKEAERYGKLKQRLAGLHPGDRISYTQEKTGYIVSVTEKAKKYFCPDALIR